MYTLHCTQKLLTRIRQPVAASLPTATTALGNWYATVLPWRPQVALFVNESTRLPLFMPLAPVKTLAARFRLHLEEVLLEHGMEPDFVARELAAMAEVAVAKTASRSILGSMNEFTWLAENMGGAIDAAGLLVRSMYLAETPIGPMRGKSPGNALYDLVERSAGCIDIQ